MTMSRWNLQRYSVAIWLCNDDDDDDDAMMME